mgnify:CR=1 FL=1
MAYLFPSNVISIFSDAYTNVPVEYYNGYWQPWQTTVSNDFSVNGDNVLNYTNFNFVGIEFDGPTVNATAMTHFHTDVWSSDFTDFKVKLVDLGANGVFGGGDDVEHEITIPSPAKGSWVSLDIPLSSFTGLTTRAHIGQLIYVGIPSGTNTVYIDNVYFHN